MKGTRPLVSVEDQPELLSIQEKYFEKGGCFWVAKENGRVIGCIGLMNCGNGTGILKKFFSYEDYRGVPHRLGRKLYAELFSFAQKYNFRQLVLDTPKNSFRAHRFEFLKDKGADLAIIIYANSVATAPWTIYKCKFGCRAYGNNLCCPPNAPSYKETQEILDSYSKAILFRTHEINTITPRNKDRQTD